MTTSLTSVVAGIQDLVVTVTGIRLAPDSLPATVQVFPAVLVYPANGTAANNGAGFATELHTFNVDLFVDSADWAKAYAQGTALIDLLLRKFEQNITLSSTVQTFGNLSYSFIGQVEISGIPTIQWQIQIVDAKLQHSW
jgi:protein involved in polysaccharide export with SLBB domain